MIGSWRPGGFPPEITLAAKLALLGAMAVRGVDYLAGDSESTARRLSAVESAAPLWVWGTLMLTAAVVGFGSIIIRRGGGLVGAHVVGLVAYLALGVGIVSDVAKRELLDWSALIAPAVVLVGGAVAVWVVCKITRWEYAELTTAAVAVTSALAVASIEFDGLRSATILIAVGSIHGMMALGTAEHLRQAKIQEHGDIVTGEEIL